MAYRIKTDAVMTLDLLLDFVQRHKQDVAYRLRPLADAYENRYPIFFAPPKVDGKPDNRIAVNYAKYITDTFNGFFCGIPVKVHSDDENVNRYIEFLDRTNDGDNLNAEVSKLADIEGASFEMYYVKEDEDSSIGMTYLSALEAFMVVDESILERPRYFVRYYKDLDGVERGSVSDDYSVRWFYMEAGAYHWDGEEKVHGFKYVPAVEYISNDERMGLFESALPAINAYNKALSEKANDVDYFADAYMKILGVKVDPNDTAFIRRTRIINFETDLSDGSLPEVDFMQKPSADTTQENLLNRLQRDIFITSMVANISDENFGTASGIALRYKMEAMSNLFTSKARRFTSAMMERYRIIFSNVLSQMNPHRVGRDDWMGIEIRFTANYPANLESEAEVAKNLEGIVSKDTQLSVLSIVDNVKEEAERVRQETTPVFTTLADYE